MAIPTTENEKSPVKIGKKGKNKLEKKENQKKEEAMTLKQQRFCEEFVIDFNGAAAARRAGYSPKTAQPIASQNLSKLIIQKKIAELTSKLTTDAGTSAEWVLERLKLVAERCIKQAAIKTINGVPVMEKVINEKGEEGFEPLWIFDSGGAAKALGLIGKYHKMFTDKVEHSGKVEGGGTTIVLPSNGRNDIQIEQKTDDKK